LEKNDIRKGMVLLDLSIKAEAVKEFEANVLVVHNPSNMTIGSTAIMHCASIR